MMQRPKRRREQAFSGPNGPNGAVCSPLVKYSNGGCSGFEPDFLFIYSAYNFSKPYLFKIIRLYYPRGEMPVRVFLQIR